MDEGETIKESESQRKVWMRPIMPTGFGRIFHLKHSSMAEYVAIMTMITCRVYEGIEEIGVVWGGGLN